MVRIAQDSHLLSWCLPASPFNVSDAPDGWVDVIQIVDAGLWVSAMCFIALLLQGDTSRRLVPRKT